MLKGDDSPTGDIDEWCQDNFSLSLDDVLSGIGEDPLLSTDSLLLTNPPPHSDTVLWDDLGSEVKHDIEDSTYHVKCDDSGVSLGDCGAPSRQYSTLQTSVEQTGFQAAYKMEPHTLQTSTSPIVPHSSPLPMAASHSPSLLSAGSSLSAAVSTPSVTVNAPVVYAALPRSLLTVNGSTVAVPAVWTAANHPAPIATLLVGGTPAAPSSAKASCRPQGNQKQQAAPGGSVEENPRYSHKVVERRYRNSINDRMQELRSLVCGEKSDGKMTKSLILRKAIDYIRFLRHQNQRLRQHLSATSPGLVTPAGSELAAREAPSRGWSSLTTPPHSDSSPSSPDELTPLFPVPAAGTDDYQRGAFDLGISSPLALSDGSRIALCMVLAAFVALNPVQRLADAVGGSNSPDFTNAHTVPGRTMLSFPMLDGYLPSWLWTDVFWLLSVFLLSTVLLVVLAVGEPRLRRGSRRERLFNSLRQRAELHYSRNEADAVYNCLCSALTAAGRPLPRSLLGWTASLGWQFVRQLVHRVPAAQLVMKTARKLLLSRSECDGLRVVSAGCALTYHRLHQLDLCGVAPARRSPLSGLTWALAALNCADLAGSELSGPGLSVLNQLHCTVALRMRAVPLLGGWVAGRLLGSCVEDHRQQQQEGERSVGWLTLRAGQMFVLNHRWSLRSSADTGGHAQLVPMVVTADPLLRVRREFQKFLLTRALTTLATPGGRVTNDDSQSPLRRSHVTDVLADCDLLLLMTGSDSSEDTVDSSVRWWALLAKLMASCWLQRPDSETECLRRQLGELKPPTSPLTFHLSRAALLASWLLQEELPADQQLLTMCTLTTGALEKSMKLSAADGRVEECFQLCQLLIADLLLQTYTQHWQQGQLRGELSPLSCGLRALFERALWCVRAVARRRPSALSRAFLHESAWRLMSDAEPHRTRALLQRSLRHRRSHAYSLICGEEPPVREFVGEREHALALMLACRHMPDGLVVSCAGERAGMLAEAASALRRIGDLRQLSRCCDMMRAMGAAVPIASS